MTWQWNLNSGFQSSLAGFQIPNAEFLIPKPQAKTFPVLDTGFRIPDSGFRITLRYGTTNRENVRFVLLQNELNRAFSLTWSASCKFIETKEIVCIRKKFNVHRIGLRHQHGRRFIVLEHPWPPWRHVKRHYRDVACFTAHESNLSCNKSACCRLRKVDSSSTFCKKICTICAFYRPKANLFCSKWRNSHV